MRSRSGSKQPELHHTVHAMGCCGSHQGWERGGESGWSQELYVTANDVADPATLGSGLREINCLTSVY